MIAVRSALAALALAGLLPANAFAQDRPVELAAEITVDAVGQVAGAGGRAVRALTNIDLTADIDLGAIAAWQGAKAHIYVLDNRGARPNDSIGTIQGVDNIEVPDAGLRLFEAWVEQDLGSGASLRMGLYDVNSEFYANDAAGLLIAPPFGIGSELAATGPNGPSIFPSSALAARLHVPLGASGTFVRLGVVNARASTLGDEGGVDFSFRDGVLLIAEVGQGEGRLRGSLGAWTYTRNPEDLIETKPDGTPLREASRGVYGVLEGDLMSGESRTLTAFLRVGLSESHATPFRAGFQAGLYMAPALPGRPDSQVSLGVHHAWTGNHYRDLMRAQGEEPGDESTVELTLSDRILPWLALQPDVQWIHNPGAYRNAPDALLAILRTTISF